MITSKYDSQWGLICDLWLSYSLWYFQRFVLGKTVDNYDDDNEDDNYNAIEWPKHICLQKSFVIALKCFCRFIKMCVSVYLCKRFVWQRYKTLT